MAAGTRGKHRQWCLGVLVLAALSAWGRPAFAQSESGSDRATSLRDGISPARIRASGAYVGDAASSVSNDLGGLRGSFELAAPLAVGRDTELLPLARYGFTDRFRFAWEPGQSRSLHSAQLGLGVAHRLSDAWSFEARATAGLASTFEDTADLELQFRGEVLIRQTVTPSLRWGFGLAAGHRFGAFAAYPLLELDWQAHPLVRLQAQLPRWAKASLTFGDRAEVFLRGDLTGNRYVSDLAQQPGDVPGLSEEIQHRQFRGSVGAAVRIAGNLWVGADVGAVFRQDLRFRGTQATVPGGAAPLQEFNLDYQPALAASGWLEWRFGERVSARVMPAPTLEQPVPEPEAERPTEAPADEPEPVAPEQPSEPEDAEQPEESGEPGLVCEPTGDVDSPLNHFDEYPDSVYDTGGFGGGGGGGLLGV